MADAPEAEVSVVAGADADIGRAIVLRLSHEGTAAVVNGRSPQTAAGPGAREIAAMRDQLPHYGGRG